MGKFVVGDVVVVRFPFSNLSAAKLRPALVLAEAEFDNLILSQITSKPYSNKKAILINRNDFKKGDLPVTSYVRPDKLFTAEQEIVTKIAGTLKNTVLEKILAKVRVQFEH